MEDISKYILFLKYISHRKIVSYITFIQVKIQSYIFTSALLISFFIKYNVKSHTSIYDQIRAINFILLINLMFKRI